MHIIEAGAQIEPEALASWFSTNSWLFNYYKIVLWHKSMPKITRAFFMLQAWMIQGLKNKTHPNLKVDTVHAAKAAADIV